MRSLIATALLAAVIKASDADPEIGEAESADYSWGYKENGRDWGSIEPFCGIGKEQSPIDLNEGAEENDKMEINAHGYMNYPDGKFITLNEHGLQMDFTDGEF